MNNRQGLLQFSIFVKKINLYNQMAQVLMGFSDTGTILQFDQDGNIDGGGTKHQDCILKIINSVELLFVF